MTKSDTHGLGLTSNLDTEVGKVVVEMGLATHDEIKFCQEHQKQSSDPNQRYVDLPMTVNGTEARKTTHCCQSRGSERLA